MTDMTAFIAGLPKAELHLHIEGTFEPELMLAIAARNGLPAPFPSVAAARAAYEFGNLQEFLDLYYRGMNVLLAERDFHDLTMAYLERARADNVRHAEIFFDPQAHTGRGVALATAIDGIWSALVEGERRLGITSRLIPCFLRDLDEAAAMATFEACLAWRNRICGFGLDSAERGNPPEKFARVFARVRAEGFHVVAHAGEEGPAAYVADALDLLGAERIDHGIHAMDDDALVRRLAAAGTVLTVCPLSNVRLKVVPEIGAHPLARMLRAGLKVTVNSDDPPYFGGYVGDNFVAVQQALGLTRRELATLSRNGFEGAFIDGATRARLIAELDAYLAAAGADG
jgi:adenosine deaminase